MTSGFLACFCHLAGPECNRFRFSVSFKRLLSGGPQPLTPLAEAWLPESGIANAVQGRRSRPERNGNSLVFVHGSVGGNRKGRLSFRLVAGHLLCMLAVGITHQAAAQSTETTKPFVNQTPEQLEQTAANYERFLANPPVGIPSSSVNEAEVRLGTVYFLLHRYRDSLGVLERVSKAPSAAGKAAPNDAKDILPPSLRSQVWLVSGLDYLELNQSAEAMLRLQHAVEMQPKNTTARMALGDALARNNRMEEALKEYEQQIKETPALTEAWYKLGLAHSFVSTQPLRDTRKNPEGVVVRQWEAEQLIGQGRNLDAARALFKLVRDAHDQPGLHADLGRALLEVGYPKAAEDQLKKEMAIDPANPSARLDLAQTAALRGAWEEVNKQMTQVSAAQPRTLTRLLEMPPAGLVQQAWTEGKMRMPDEFAGTSVGGLWHAWMDQSQLIQVKGSDGAVAVRTCPTIASAAHAQGAWLTESCYSELIKRMAGNKNSSLPEKIKLAEAEFRLQQYDQALQTAKAILHADAGNEWAIYWFRNAHRGLAQQCLLKVADLDPQSVRAHQMLAQDYAAWLQFPKAKKEYQQAISLAPGQSDLHLGLGTIYWRTTNWAEAEKELKTALELAPESALARYELGDTYVQQADWQRALEQLRKIPPDSTVSYEATLDLAKAESELGQTTEAIQSLLSIAPRDEDGQAHFLLASLYRKSGDPGRAQEALETFKQLRAAALQASKDEAGALEEDRASNRN
jgi:tetratricopeptide (TPR) repeat protein